jgi:16S rRNA (uracil1498-N3)-methyltransferase
MANELFVWVPEWDLSDNIVVIFGEEHHHLSRVLRIKPGSNVILLNGKGHGAKSIIREIHKDRTICCVESKLDDPIKDSVAINLAVGLIRRPRWEWLLEKSVEMGVSRIIPLITQYSVPEKIRQDRDLKIMISALKQSGRFTLPELDDPTPFDILIKNLSNRGILLHNEHKLPYLMSLKRLKREDVTLCIGPEGGFSEEEIDLAQKAGVETAQLGKIRLRTETAALCALNICSVWDQEV